MNSENSEFQTADDTEFFSDPQKDGNLFGPGTKSSLKRGQMIYNVRDHGLAVCLFSVGIPMREDPPYISVDVGTEESPRVITTYNFMPCSEDGALDTGKLIKAWTKDLDFLAEVKEWDDRGEEHPMHSFSVAMAAWKNAWKFLDHHKNDTPYVAYITKRKGRAAHMLVKKGSRKDRAAQKRGLRRVVKALESQSQPSRTGSS